MPVLKDVELQWCKLNPTKPEVDDYGSKWTLTAVVDKATYDQWVADDLPGAKEKDGKYTIRFKRKTEFRDGSPNRPVRVVDGSKKDIDMNEVAIANGSKGNVAYSTFNYGPQKDKTTTVLEILQLTTLIPYNSPIDELEEVETTILEPHTEEVDDDLPF